MKNSKYTLLKKGLLYDAVGIVTTFIPVVGPFLDVLWAPFAAKKMTEMYQGETGKIAAIIVFVEELLPMTDVVPTFTLMWLYTFVIKGAKYNKMEPIEVKVNE